MLPSFASAGDEGRMWRKGEVVSAGQQMRRRSAMVEVGEGSSKRASERSVLARCGQPSSSLLISKCDGHGRRTRRRSMMPGLVDSHRGWVLGPLHCAKGDAPTSAEKGKRKGAHRQSEMVHRVAARGGQIEDESWTTRRGTGGERSTTRPGRATPAEPAASALPWSSP